MMLRQTESTSTNTRLSAISPSARQTHSNDDTEAFKKHFSQQAGFVEAYWHEKAFDHPVLKELSVTPRFIPLGQDHPPGKCVLSGEPTSIKVLFAKSY
jgi:prolyl-tRNA synthetase